jgi:hypothetical protein
MLKVSAIQESSSAGALMVALNLLMVAATTTAILDRCTKMEGAEKDYEEAKRLEHVEVTKEGSQKGNFARVIDPDFNGMLKVQMTSGKHAGKIKTYKQASTRACRPVKEVNDGARARTASGSAADVDLSEVFGKKEESGSSLVLLSENPLHPLSFRKGGPAAAPAVSAPGRSPAKTARMRPRSPTFPKPKRLVRAAASPATTPEPREPRRLVPKASFLSHALAELTTVPVPEQLQKEAQL